MSEAKSGISRLNSSRASDKDATLIDRQVLDGGLALAGQKWRSN